MKTIYRLRQSVGSAIVPVSHASVAVRPVTHRVVGDPDQVRSVIRNARIKGTLVEFGVAHPMSRGRIAVDVTLLQPATHAHGAKGRFLSRRRAVVAGVGVALVLIATAAYGVVLFAAWLLAHALILLGLAVAVAPFAVLGVRAGCRGLHCGGCSG
jgi:hypothetical protein